MVGHRIVDCSCSVAAGARKVVAKLVGDEERTLSNDEDAGNDGVSAVTQTEVVNELHGPWLFASSGRRRRRSPVERGPTRTGQGRQRDKDLPTCRAAISGLCNK